MDFRSLEGSADFAGVSVGPGQAARVSTSRRPSRICGLSGSEDDMVVMRLVHRQRRRAASASRKLVLAVPGLGDPGDVGPVGRDVPGPDHGVEPQRDRRGAFGSKPFPALGVFCAQALFDFAIDALDGPASRVQGGDFPGVASRLVVKTKSSRMMPLGSPTTTRRTRWSGSVGYHST